jgi:hypothetical protein
MLLVSDDIVPIGIVVFEHRRNFRQTKSEKIRQIYIPKFLPSLVLNYAPILDSRSQATLGRTPDFVPKWGVYYNHELQS